MGKAKKAPKKKPAGVKDLDPRSARRITGGRQTAKTDFGSVLGRGISKATDAAEG